MIDALVIRQEDGRRLAAAWTEVEAYDKLVALPGKGRGCIVERVRVSGRLSARRATRAAREVGDYVPPLPRGYRIVPPRRLSPATLRARPWTDWRRTLAAVVAASPRGGWVRAGDFADRYGTDVHSLQARGMIDIAQHRSKSNLYRSTLRGRRAVGS